MSPSQEISREGERLQQAIDAEIKSLEESIRVLRLRRNALSPISSLPPEVFENVLLCLPAVEDAMSDHNQPEARVIVSHVCHQWREIAINQPLLWNNVDLTTLSLAGTTEILARAKSKRLYLKAMVPCRRHWDDLRFSRFQKELQTRLPDVCHLTIRSELIRLHKTLGELRSPAPTLESLSLFSCGGSQTTETGRHLFVPDTLFNGSSPMLSCLKLFNCEISWESPLLKGLRHLEMRTPNLRPKLSTWLDALDEMSQLKTLVLHSASPITPRDDINHIATLPSLTHLEILASPAGCALALAHLDLPALTGLSITVAPLLNSDDILVLLPHLARHAHGPQDTRPLQSMLFRSEGNGAKNGAKILAWPVPDIDIQVQDPSTFLATTLPGPRVALFFTIEEWYGTISTRDDVLEAAMSALPLSSLVTLLVQNFTSVINKHFWLCLAPKWPLLRRVQLEAPAKGFKRCY